MAAVGREVAYTSHSGRIFEPPVTDVPAGGAVRRSDLSAKPARVATASRLPSAAWAATCIFPVASAAPTTGMPDGGRAAAAAATSL